MCNVLNVLVMCFKIIICVFYNNIIDEVKIIFFVYSFLKIWLIYKRNKFIGGDMRKKIEVDLLI